MLSSSIVRYGSEAPLPERTTLRAGALSLIYEQGDLRTIRIGEREIVRRIYVAVRDRNWGTVPARLYDLKIEAQEDRFHVSYWAEHLQGDIAFRWQGTIVGTAENEIQFTMEGLAESDFLRNRIGFCILHPAQCEGNLFTALREDGSEITAPLPLLIDPNQPVLPFHDLRGFRQEVGEGTVLEMAFEGDLFEMEDQRNWTDASYKTFCTPLSLPFPVALSKGQSIRQSLRLSLQNAGIQPRSSSTAPITLTVSKTPLEWLPPIGLGVSSVAEELDSEAIRLLKALNLSHLRAELTLSDPHFPAALEHAAKEANALELPLEIGVLLSENAEAELQALLPPLEALKPQVVRWIVYPLQERMRVSPDHARLIDAARAALAPYNPQATFAAGTNSDFLFLNRFPPPLEHLDALAFSLCPQTHAFDNASLMETPQAQGAVVRSAKALAQGKPVVVSPVTLKPRFNPYATGATPETPSGELPPTVDPRQMSLFGAAWTVASLKHLFESGAGSLTYFETQGWRGVLDTALRSPRPFPHSQSRAFPLYQVLGSVRGRGGTGQVCPTTSSAPLQVEALTLYSNTTFTLLIANLTNDSQAVRLPSNLAQAGEDWKVALMDEASLTHSSETPIEFWERVATLKMGETLELPPYAVAFCVVWRKLHDL